MSGHRYTDELELEVLSVGPEVAVGGVRLGPDEVIALEGAGTFESISARRLAERLMARGKDLEKYARRVHMESTRRGHASLTTSANLFYEVRECSRLLSTLLVSPPFGSHLQESQRRVQVTRERLLVPAELRERRLERDYLAAMDRAFEAYRGLLGEGIEAEDARYLLPLSSATSLSSSISFEAYVGLLSRASRVDGYVPEELRAWASKLREEIAARAPLLLEARLRFSGGHNYYPSPDPTRPPDGLFDRLDPGPLDEEATILSVEAPPQVREVLEGGAEESRDALNPLVRVSALERMSLVAYHQAIRHRTVPTSVESLHDAAARCFSSPSSSIVVPPSLRGREGLTRLFMDTCVELLEVSQRILGEGLPAASLYPLPQSLRIRAIRVYNLFNLLYPTGFIATRTCSYAQWEERGIAYKIWRGLERTAPWLASRMGEKCRHLGYCPEREWCPIILKYHPYSDEAHKRHNEWR